MLRKTIFKKNFSSFSSISFALTIKLFNESYISIVERMVKKSKKKEMISNKFFRYLLIIAGTISLAFGIIGVFLPILPTTPFLLLTAACYARSSQRFYNWLINNKWFGNYIKHYHEGKGIPVKFKIFTISLLWITILTSVYFVINNFWIKILLMIIAIGVTIHIITIKTYKHNN